MTTKGKGPQTIIEVADKAGQHSIFFDERTKAVSVITVDMAGAATSVHYEKDGKPRSIIGPESQVSYDKYGEVSEIQFPLKHFAVEFGREPRRYLFPNSKFIAHIRELPSKALDVKLYELKHDAKGKAVEGQEITDAWLRHKGHMAEFNEAYEFMRDLHRGDLPAELAKAFGTAEGLRNSHRVQQNIEQLKKLRLD